MTLSQFSVFLLTFLAFGLIVVFVKKNRHWEKDVITYSIGEKDYISNIDEENLHKLLHVAQVLKKVNPGELSVIEVPFPHNDQNYVIKFVKVLNYNSAYSTRELLQKDDDNFWVLIADGGINTNSIKMEINSYLDVDADVEFYGFKDEIQEL